MSACQSSDSSTAGPCSVNNTNPLSIESEDGESASNNPQPEDPPEVLGSVVQSHELENGDKNSSVQLRTSARVSKKMRLDSIASQAPPERKDLPKEEDKLDTKPKRRPFELWPQEDKNTFFEALNEFGKDFDAIQRYFEAKAKRKNLPDHMIKNKEQIRHFYYRTWHKISKHLRFPEEVKKATQELYGLINFGEIRKKIGSLSEKNSLKLNELIYRGFTTMRVRGKTIRFKTPICRALRKLNQQEELAEDLKLPARVTVELRPRTNEAWACVQATAQNPRIQTLLPLQRRLSTLLNFLEHRWQPHTLKHCERLQSQLNEVTANIVSSNEMCGNNGAPLCNGEKQVVRDEASTSVISNTNKHSRRPLHILRVAPKSDTTITPLTINLSEYFTSTRLSLNSHEERLGNHAAEELFNSMLHASNKGCGRRGAKRPRHDSSSEKKKDQSQQLPQFNIDSSPEKSKDGSLTGLFTPLENDDDKPSCPFRLFGSGVCLDAGSSNADSDGKVNGDSGTLSKSSLSKDETDINSAGGSVNGGVSHDNAAASSTQQTAATAGSAAVESNEDTIKRVRSGWTIENANAVTIGELYLMFGADSKVKLEYWWEERQDDASSVPESAEKIQESSETPASLLSPDKKASTTSNKISTTLQKLLSISKMYSTQAKCPCGHVCNGTPKPSVTKAKVSRPVRGNAEADKLLKTDILFESSTGSSPNSSKMNMSLVNDGPFRRPLMPSPHFKPPPRPGTADAFKAQLEKFRPRGCNRRGRPVSVRKNVVVPRMLPLLPKAPQNSSLITFQVIPQSSPMSGDFLPIAQSPSILNFTPSSTSSSGLLVHQISESQNQVTSTKSINNSDSSMPDLDISMPDLCDEVSPQRSSMQKESIKNKDRQPQSCHLVQDLFPPTLDTPVNSPPSISNLLDLSLPSELGLNPNPLLETNFTGLLSNSGGVSNSPPPASPSTILKEDENQWLNSEDFSLSSFLGHLESPLKTASGPLQDTNEQTSISDVETHMQCLMAESSLDYVAKFADLAAQMASDGASKS